MKDILKDIVRLLREGTPELQVAAAQVLGELRPTDHGVVEGLAEQLHRGDERILGRYLLTALSQDRHPRRCRDPRRPPRQRGCRSATRWRTYSPGWEKIAHKPLADLFVDAGPDLRPRILEIFGKHVGKDAIRVLREALVDP